jgi:hypothetical protein
VDPEVIVGVGSAALSVIGAVTAGVMANRSAKQAHELDRQRRLETQIEQAKRIEQEYRDPLLDAAHTLQGRLFNIIAQSYLSRYLHSGNAEQERYARDYTVYAIADYLCWVEILRRELRFLDLGDIKRNRDLMELLTHIQYTFQRDDLPSAFEVFRGRQRAIAEVMMVPTNATDGPRNESMGYAAYCYRLDTATDFASWFTKLRADVEVVEQSTDDENVRLVLLQRDLLDLIDFLDPNCVRRPASWRNRLPEPRRPGPSEQRVRQDQKRR